MILPNIKFIKLNLDQLDTDYKKKMVYELVKLVLSLTQWRKINLRIS